MAVFWYISFIYLFLAEIVSTILREINENKDIRLKARRKDAKSVKIKENAVNVKF